jgi:glycosyltransferase involved in cell wall biosynthesis
MAEKFLFLLGNPQTAQKMGARGREIVEEKFSLDAQLQNTLRIYDRALSGK